MRLLPFLCLLVTLPLAAVTVSVNPPNPTSATPVTITLQEYVTCPSTPEVARTGNRFDISFSPGICLTPPVLGTFTVPLGLLEPGDYEVVIDFPGAGTRGGYAGFYVREDQPQVRVVGQSVGPTFGGTKVTLLASDAVLCFGPDRKICPLPGVTFNGVAATVDEQKFVQGSLVVFTPPNAKGLADVVVTGSRGSRHGRVFRYYDPAEAPPASMFERVLVPVYAKGPGAFGSQWTTDVTILNAGVTDMEPYRSSPGVIATPSTTVLDFGTGTRAGGVLFFPPRDFSQDIAFGALVRDVSRQDGDWGTEVRVVRESELRGGMLSLLNVPIDPRFRVTLRIDDADSVNGFAYVKLYSMSGEEVGSGRFVPLLSANPCERFVPCASLDPAAGVVDLLTLFPEAENKKAVRIDVAPITGSHPLFIPHMWALASVTNNDTQHVTVISPQ